MLRCSSRPTLRPTSRARRRPQLGGIAGVEERLAERLAADAERRHGHEIEMDVMHDMGLTSEGGDEQHEGAMERDVEAQIEQHLRDHIAHGGFPAREEGRRQSK